MSVEIETSAQSMSESLNSLRVTPSPMHRIYMKIGSIQVWYKIMREANAYMAVTGAANQGSSAD
jgi:hypothetical protein